MEKYNICKFNLNRSSDLICENFIYETEKNPREPRLSLYNTVNLVVKGNGVALCDWESFPIKEGCLFFVMKGERFSVSSDGELEYMYISFHGRRAGEYFERLGISAQNRIFPGHGELAELWRHSIEMSESGNIDMLSEAVLLYSLAHLDPVNNDKGDIVSRIVAMTHENFNDPDMSISHVAAELGYDAKYLSGLFKKKKGIAYTVYLRDIRLKHAVFLMENGVVSVKNVAILSGFRDALYFSKLFTAAEGMSPKAYIEKIARDNKSQNN